VTIMPSRRV